MYTFIKYTIWTLCKKIVVRKSRIRTFRGISEYSKELKHHRRHLIFLRAKFQYVILSLDIFQRPNGFFCCFFILLD